MASGSRTLLRGFLLVGGLVLAGIGVADGSTVDVAIGGVAAVLGAVGLWLELRPEEGGLEPGEGDFGPEEGDLGTDEGDLGPDEDDE